MGSMVSQITSLTLVYSTVFSGPYQRKHQSSASLAFMRRIYRGPVKSPHKWPVTRKMFPFDDVIMKWCMASVGRYYGLLPCLVAKSLQLCENQAPVDFITSARYLNELEWLNPDISPSDDPGGNIRYWEWFSLWYVFSAAIGPRGIRVNTVNPATVKTDMFNKPDGPGGNAEKKQAVSGEWTRNHRHVKLWYYKPACDLSVFVLHSTVHV